MGLEVLPVSPIQRLSEKLSDNQVYIKRDDLLPYSFGGNKVRKAALFLKEIRKKKADVVITYGSSSSNHCRVIANMASTENISCIIISPEESNLETVNRKLVRLFGAKIIECPLDEVSSTIEMTISKLEKSGKTPYFIEGGGHGNLGTESYVQAFNEIQSYEKESNVFFDYIFVTSGTGTTQAGLICGNILSDTQKKIIGISNARKNPRGSEVILDSVNNYLKEISNYEIQENEEVEVVFIDDYIFGGYGRYNEAVISTAKKILNTDGIPLDMTYTAKGFYGMEQYLHCNNIKNKKILFIHTGGTPLFFDNLEELFND